MAHDFGEDARRHARHSASASVFIKFAGRMLSGQLKDVSTRSFCVTMSAPIPMGAMVEVVIMHQSKTAVIKGYVEIIRDGEVVVSSAAASSLQLNSFFSALVAS